jgi:DNA-binding LytR/AlgR family response regulator
VLRVLVIDRPAARRELSRLLSAHPQVAIVGGAGSFRSARIRLAADDYDLVFLDVQVPGGTGFDLLPDVKTGARVVFVTACDRSAVRAFEVNASDYLLKPVRENRLAASLGRIHSASAPAVAEASDRGAASWGEDRMHLRTGPLNTRWVRLREIVSIRSCENYSEVQLADGVKYFVRQTMKAWETRLPVANFVRVHRHSIVGLHYYGGLDYAPGGSSRLFLTGCPRPHRASYRYLPVLRARLAALGKSL